MMLKKGMLIGLVVGAAIGAMVVEGWQPAQDAVCKSKHMLKSKLDDMSRKCIC